MSKRRQKQPNYRLQYSPELRASINRKLAVSSQPNHSLVKARCFLLSLIILIAMIAIGAIHFYDRQHKAEAIRTTNQIGDASATKKVIRPPYNTAIGFVGDSLTDGANGDEALTAPDYEMIALGEEYQAINKGLSGSTTEDWVSDGLLSAAMDEFKGNDVEIVQVMLGTNDIARGASVEAYLDNMRQIITDLQNNGVKVIMVNKIPPCSWVAREQVVELNTAIDSLAGDNVYIGDEKALEYFEEHRGLQHDDGTHMTVEGDKALGQLWAEAFTKVITKAKLNDYRLANGV